MKYFCLCKVYIKNKLTVYSILSISIEFLMFLFLIGITVNCLSAEPVGYWTFDDGSGEKAKDQSGNGNDGILQGNPKWTNGIRGRALDFNRENQDYVEIESSDTVSLAEEFTMSAWIKLRSVYKGEDWKFRNAIIAKLRAYYFDINGEGNLACTFYDQNGNAVGWVPGKTDMESCIDKWVNVVATFDGESVNITGCRIAKRRVQSRRDGQAGCLFYTYTESKRSTEEHINDIVGLRTVKLIRQI